MEEFCEVDLLNFHVYACAFAFLSSRTSLVNGEEIRPKANLVPSGGHVALVLGNEIAQKRQNYVKN